MTGRKLSDQSFLAKGRQRSRKLIARSREKVNSFRKYKESTNNGVTNEEIQDRRQGPPENCVIGVGTGQIDGSNAGFAREQWDRVAWRQTILTHCARIAGNQIRNRQRLKEMKSFSQKIQLEVQRLLTLGTRTKTKGRQRQGRVNIESQDPRGQEAGGEEISSSRQK